MKTSLCRLCPRLGNRNWDVFLKKFTNRLNIFSYFTFITGLVWLFILPYEGQYRHTYISENALLPGQVQTYFRSSEWNILRGYKEEIKLLINKTEIKRMEKISNMLSDIGYETDVYDTNGLIESNLNSGLVSYGLLHAPRGDDTESIVIGAPWINKDGELNINGVALSLALARFVSRWSIWSKNIIFVVPSDPKLSLRLWVNAYHSYLPLYGGSIQGAMILDYPSDVDHFDQIEIFYEGLNGQLPNLDLINTVVVVCNLMGIDTVIQGQQPQQQYLNIDANSSIQLYLYEYFQKYIYSYFNSYIRRLKTLLTGVKNQALAGLGSVAGCEAFSGWRIDAVTLTARKISSSAKHDETEYGRVVESVIRSINNLLEHFHQSFFFYLLLSPVYFVSIGTYLPAAMLMGISFVLMGLYLIRQKSPNMGNNKNSKEDENSDIINNKEIEKSDITNSNDETELLKPFIIALLAGLVDLSIACITFFCNSDVLKRYYLKTVTLGSILIPLLIKTLSKPLSEVVVMQFYSLALIMLGFELVTLSTLNFSLAYLMGATLFGLLFIRPNMSAKYSIPILILSNPFTYIYLIGNFFFNSSSVNHGATGSTGFLLELVNGWRELGSWIWLVVIWIWLPSWIAAAFTATVKTTKV